MKREGAKDFNIAHGFKDIALQLLLEVNLAFHAIAETKPDCKTGNVSAFDDPNHHCLLQRRNWPKRFPCLGQLAVLTKLFPVRLIPF